MSPDLIIPPVYATLDHIYAKLNDIVDKTNPARLQIDFMSTTIYNYTQALLRVFVACILHPYKVMVEHLVWQLPLIRPLAPSQKYIKPYEFFVATKIKNIFLPVESKIWTKKIEGYDKIVFLCNLEGDVGDKIEQPVISRHLVCFIYDIPAETLMYFNGHLRSENVHNFTNNYFMAYFKRFLNEYGFQVQRCILPYSVFKHKLSDKVLSCGLQREFTDRTAEDVTFNINQTAGYCTMWTLLFCHVFCVTNNLEKTMLTLDHNATIEGYFDNFIRFYTFTLVNCLWNTLQNIKQRGQPLTIPNMYQYLNLDYLNEFKRVMPAYSFL
jgi:hypothetical protein